MRRPAEVKEDVRQMHDRSRVSLILNSEAFRRELEEVVEEHIKSGPHPASLLALQQITDLLLPHSRGQAGLIGRGSKQSNGGGGGMGVEGCWKYCLCIETSHTETIF